MFITAMRVTGNFVAKKSSGARSLHGRELKRTTKQFWKKDNRGYV